MRNKTIKKVLEPFVDWVNSSEENNIKDQNIIESFIEYRQENNNSYPDGLIISCGRCGFKNESVNKYCFNCLSLMR